LKPEPNGGTAVSSESKPERKQRLSFVCNEESLRELRHELDRNEIRNANPGIAVTEVVGDITTRVGREAVLKACPEPDIVINNASGPPPGDFRNWTRDDWIKALDANMLTPIELIKATVDGMMARKFGRIVNITSAAVKAPIDVPGLSNGARAGLTASLRALHAKL
jgi:3-oxoacyl-[acyl-carrier protein] reductase